MDGRPHLPTERNTLGQRRTISAYRRIIGRDILLFHRPSLSDAILARPDAYTGPEPSSCRVEFSPKYVFFPGRNSGCLLTHSLLELVLEEHYWNHVANFPMHFGGLSTQAVDELIGVFLHGRADRMTSKVSTFPYGAAECANFLDLLKTARDDISSGYSTCLVARLWSFIVSNRFGTHYGQEHVRLSRDQAILVETGSQKHWFFTSASRVFFGAPDMYTSLFDKIFVDDLVYEDQWRIFMSTCREDWKMSIYWVSTLVFSSLFYLYQYLHYLSGIPLAHVSLTKSFLSSSDIVTNSLIFRSSIVMSFVKMASPALTIATSLICSMSILAGMHLLVRHQELADSSASLAVQYLQANRSNTFGFQHMALIFSLPKALCLWSLGFFVAHWIFIAARMISTVTAIAYVVLLFVLVLGVRQSVAQESVQAPCSPRPRCYFARLFSRFSSDEGNATEETVEV
jgi:hypothetical protein